ncbi:MAG: hypothetical protein WCT19_01565 [Candidatus Paceibacterota bacterium]|jgi:hypothetical protein
MKRKVVLKEEAEQYDRDEILDMTVEEFETFVFSGSLRFHAKEFFNTSKAFRIREILELSLAQVSNEIWKSLTDMRNALKDLGFDPEYYKFLRSND